MMSSSSKNEYKPILPQNPQLIVEDTDDLVLCKPRLIPLKTFTLEKLEKMQQEAQKLVESQNQQLAEN